MIIRDFTRTLRVGLALLLLLGMTSQANGQSMEETNSALVRQAFEDWENGRGSVFDLLADDAEWVVAGVSPVSATYPTRQALVEEAVEPIHAKLATAITPEVKHGAAYNNSYAWHLVMEAGAITRVTAFLDTWALVELME